VLKVMLIANPRAGSVSERTRDVIVKALRADFDLDVRETAARDHATELARDAVDAGFDAVLVFGGDGTINEAAQPLVTTDVALGFLPGGTTNVLARSLGVPRDPVEATAYAAARLRSRSTRRIGVGQIGERCFLFSCGMGLDAEVVKRVEEDPAKAYREREWVFLKHAFAAGATTYRTTRPNMTLEAEGRDPVRAVFAVCCNGRPFTFFKSFPVDACPEARLDRELDVLALHRVRLGTIPRIVWALFVSRSHTRWKTTTYLHDIGSFRLDPDDPMPVQVDGDYIGPHGAVDVRHVGDALTLIA